jgi:hypothetical protein
MDSYPIAVLVPGDARFGVHLVSHSTGAPDFILAFSSIPYLHQGLLTCAAVRGLQI